MDAIRAQMKSSVEEAGSSLNELRMAALTNNMPFVAGILRGAEEAVLVAFNMLKDDGTDRKEL